MKDKFMLEESEKMCEYCCNFDKEHIGMDCTALCKLTMTHAYAEDYGGDCMFYNVPKEQIIVLPCKVGDSCYPLWHFGNKPIVERKISRITYSARNIIIGYYENDGQYRPPLRTRVLGEDIFLTREEAEKALNERKRK